MRRYRMPKPRGSFLGKWTHGRKFIGASSYDEADDMEDRVGLTGEGYDEPLPGGRVSPKVKRVLIGLGVLFVLGLLLVLLWETIANMTLKMQGVPTGLWSKRGKLMIGKDTPFFIKGFSWYGMEEENHVFGGLADTPADAMLKLAVDNNFNAIRVPLAYNNWRNNPDIGTGIDHLMNSLISIGDGHFYYLELLDKMIEMSGKKNILILLDLHRLNSAESELSGLWYSRTVSEDDVVDFWRKVCDRYYRTWNVMGVDITNEPYKGLWDNSKSPNNWKRAAERITNAVHAKCPHWLVMIEGVGKHAETLTDQPFWGENIHAMKHARLAVQFPKKVALSPHVYGKFSLHFRLRYFSRRVLSAVHLIDILFFPSRSRCLRAALLQKAGLHDENAGHLGHPFRQRNRVHRQCRHRRRMGRNQCGQGCSLASWLHQVPQAEGVWLLLLVLKPGEQGHWRAYD